MGVRDTLTTTGYGHDAHWRSPLMVAFVISVQFFGLVVTISVVPVVLIPWFESRFEARLPIYALVDTPKHRRPILLAGADAVYSPMHSLAAGLAAKASERIAPRITGVQLLGDEAEIAELRIPAESELADKSLVELNLRRRTGATILGQWIAGEFRAHPSPTTKLEAGAIAVAIGSAKALARLGELATPIDRSDPLLVIGFGEVGQKLVEMLDSVGETVRVMAKQPHERLDVCGDALDPQVLEQAQLSAARTAILALSDDSTTLFAVTIIRDLCPSLPIIAAADRAENVERIQRAGADVALSISQVTAQLLGHKLFGETFIAIEPRIRVFEASAAPFAGLSLGNARIFERTGCTVVAVNRKRRTTTEIGAQYTFSLGDSVFLVGSGEAAERFFKEFPSARVE